jgi:hypothetical protein
MILNRYHPFTSAQPPLHRGVGGTYTRGRRAFLDVSSTLIQNRRRWLALRMRCCRSLGPVSSRTAT